MQFERAGQLILSRDVEGGPGNDGVDHQKRSDSCAGSTGASRLPPPKGRRARHNVLANRARRRTESLRRNLRGLDYLCVFRGLELYESGELLAAIRGRLRSEL